MTTNRQTSTIAASTRKSASATGVLFLVTHVTSIGAVALYGPVLYGAGYITSSSPDSLVFMGALFEIILALAVIGTAVALFPIVKRQNEGIALGYVGLRTLEAGIIAVGVVPLLAAVSLRQLAGTAGSDVDTLAAVSNALISFHNWTFLVGPGLVCGTNTVLMAYLLYKSRLVPRIIPVLGLIGGPLIFAYNAVEMFRNLEPMPSWVGVTVIPIFAWELSLAIYLIAKGFKSSGVAALSEKAATNVLPNAA